MELLNSMYKIVHHTAGKKPGKELIRCAKVIILK